MTRRRNKINGILLLDKPAGITSNAALQITKKLFKANKAGHTGSLDPIATGVLPICFGQATKVSKYLIESSKIYHVVAKLGIKTSTGDLEGSIVEKKVLKRLKIKQIDEVLKLFIGRIEQIPPMFSAIKVDGVRLYKHARMGITIPRKSRRILIHNIYMKNYKAGHLELNVHCGSGTYIRTLIEDIGAKLNTYAHVTELRRISIDLIDCQNLITLEELEITKNDQELQKYLLPLDTAIQSLPKVIIGKEYRLSFNQGQKVMLESKDLSINQSIRVYDHKDHILGLGYIEKDGFLKPMRVFNFN